MKRRRAKKRSVGNKAAKRLVRKYGKQATRSLSSRVIDFLVQVATHPAALILGNVVSFVLWIPYGFGYYDFPWSKQWAVFLLLAFVVAFPTCAAIGLARRPKFLLLRYCVALPSLIVGLYGLFAMLDWWGKMWSHF